jgi:Tfp pilus assembly protein FimV
MAIAGALIAAPSAPAATQVPALASAVAGQTYTPAQAAPAQATAAQAPAQAVAQAVAQAPVPAQAAAVVAQAHTDALVIHHEPARHYTVRRGDTLSSIAQRFYGNSARWQWIFQANQSKIKNPNMIIVGEVLTIPFKAPPRSQTGTPATPTALTTTSTLSGTLSCHGLEELWEEAGGSHAEAFMAAEIAMAESSGRQFATGGVGERGYWQINPNHGALSTYDPLGNAKAAVIISSNGTNWSPWTTFTSGAFHGRC